MKYIIEIEPIEGTNLFRVVGANTLVFDQNGIDKILKPYEDEKADCQFEKDELVEVSKEGKAWVLRHFSKMSNGKAYCFARGMTSADSDESYVFPWEYCRKYGTLGGPTKETGC